MRKFFLLPVLLLPLTLAPLHAQEAGQPSGSERTRPDRTGPGGQGRGQFAGMQRVAGEVTAVSGATITVKAEDGASMQVITTDNTRIMKSTGEGNAPAPIKATELKSGDGIMAAGNLDAPTKTLHAAFVVATDAEVVKKMRADFGKTYITGKVASIDVDNLKMTVLRSDGVSQTIGFDESTSFRRGGRGLRIGGGFAGPGGSDARPRAGATPGNPPAAEGESITLADIKVGDNVAGRGSMKNGTFVPTQLNVLPTRGERRAAAPGTTGDAPAPPTTPR